MKKSILILALLFITISSSFAQDTYDYAVVQINPSIRIMTISMSGTSYEEIKLEKDEIHYYRDISVALNKVKEMETEGWELFNTNIASNVTSFDYIFYLRKKE